LRTYNNIWTYRIPVKREATLKYRILVADDDYDNMVITSEILRSSGHTVIGATNGIEAIDAAVKEKPDMIFLDLAMPKMSGWEAAEKLKSIAGTSNIPIIAFTARAMAGDERKAIDSGCDDYLSKPCTPDAILEKVTKWCKKQ
jgi:two-component system, cell cycle response regulator DivK